MHEKNLTWRDKHKDHLCSVKADDRAEILFANFITQDNLAASIADHFLYLAAEMFLDSAIAKKFRSKRTKTTVIIEKKNCLAASATGPCYQVMQEDNLLIDGWIKW